MDTKKQLCRVSGTSSKIIALESSEQVRDKKDAFLSSLKITVTHIVGKHQTLTWFVFDKEDLFHLHVITSREERRFPLWISR